VTVQAPGRCGHRALSPPGARRRRPGGVAIRGDRRPSSRESVFTPEVQAVSVHRRALLAATTAGLASAVAGCSSGGGQDRGSKDPDFDGSQPVDVDPLPAEPDGAVTELAVTWNRRAASLLNPDVGAGRQSGTGTIYVVIQLRIENVGEEPTRVLPEMFQLADTDKRLYQQLDFDDPDSLGTRRLHPGDVANGWLVWTVPNSKTRFLLAVTNEPLPDPVAVSFTFDDDLTMRIDDGDRMTTVPGGTVTTTAPDPATNASATATDSPTDDA
jgi:hypothetical protein